MSGVGDLESFPHGPKQTVLGRKERERESNEDCLVKTILTAVKGTGRGDIKSDMKRNCLSKVLKPISNHLHVTQ